MEPLNLPKKYRGKIHLIHIAPADIGLAVGDMGFQYFPEIERDETCYELEQLKNIETEIKSQGVACDYLLQRGIAKEIILQYAQEKQARYIVMGAMGEAGFMIWWLVALLKKLQKTLKFRYWSSL